jgi:hypothetical protein
VFDESREVSCLAVRTGTSGPACFVHDIVRNHSPLRFPCIGFERLDIDQLVNIALKIISSNHGLFHGQVLYGACSFVSKLGSTLSYQNTFRTTRRYPSTLSFLPGLLVLRPTVIHSASVFAAFRSSLCYFALDSTVKSTAGSVGASII